MMPAAAVTALKEIRCEEIRMPEPASGRVLVRTEMASICGSDLHIAYMGWNVNEPTVAAWQSRDTREWERSWTGAALGLFLLSWC